ncbi:leucine-rich repeat and calponin homology domain-containing protein 1-like [Limulus polyphemus]|uniref:Leucine-rich repeat and calponin homology domain-containing protein 1-like n=1 Tax=Limulus polyphemus TaxID=6850 RepID=A0ABM1TNE2_LIMPO|nr:leucine-rich repeat and calponin homology domain-containing protein 1-like [Limulus polyphemus]
MNQLMDLDVGCNKITFLPPQIGELEALRSLNLRRNFLTQLPPELCELQLVKLDISGNKISFLPIPLYYMTSLQHLVVDKNPLISPLSILCERGKAHIFKYLEVQANCKSKKQRISLELDYHQSSKKANLFSKLQTENGFEDGRSNQHMFDSHKKSCHWSQDKLYDPVLKLTNGHLVDSLKGKSKNNIIPLKEKNDCSETQQKRYVQFLRNIKV